MELDQKAMKDSGYGPFPVTVLPHVLVALPDGVHLSVKLWFPCDNKTQIEEAFGEDPKGRFLMYEGLEEGPKEREDRFPVVMEYLPYRKSDFTIPRDHRRHAWMASQGYVIARVDMRGTGDSEGLYFGEYMAEEQKDACDVIQWFCEQPWCNGKVGMYGKSWGGFNGLQVAFHQPAGLAAVVSLYSTDDLFTGDIHWDAGCVLGGGMLSWATRMFLWNCSPPCPALCPNWRQEWKERLQKASAPWCKDWLSHQTRDEFWKKGSILTDYSKVQCPVLAIGGWRDSYTDAVFRLVRSLPNVHGIIGPWSHDWPDTARPGPNIEFLQECLNWWDHHLKGKQNKVPHLPKLRVHLQDSIGPTPSMEDGWPGRWLVEPCWPPADPTRHQIFTPEGSTGVLHPVDSAPRMEECRVGVRYTSASGQWAGEWLSMGDPDAPADQQLQDGISSCWTTAPLEQDLHLLGFPMLRTKVVPAAERACLAVRLCDVFPDGRSTLITYGLLNLACYRGFEPGQPERLTPGQVYPVNIQLHAAGYTVPQGHQLRMGVSSSYWPVMWPSPKAADVNLVLGQAQIPKSGVKVFHTQLVLPTAVESPECLDTSDGHFVPKTSPTLGPELPSIKDQTIPGQFDLSSGFSFSDGLYTRTVTSDTGLREIREGPIDMSYRETSTDWYTIRELDPLSARVVIDCQLTMTWPQGPLNAEQVEVVISTHSEMTSNDHDFKLRDQVQVQLNGEKEYIGEWVDTVPRQYV